jgi:hypothetical protein
VLGAITTVLGSANACSRAARFGVSPTTPRSRAPPSPIRFADNYQPGGDPDPRRQRRACRGVETGHRFDQRQPGAHRPFGVVLIGPGIAKIGEHPVAHILGDKPAGALDDPGNAAVIGADHRPQILRVEPRR